MTINSDLPASSLMVTQSIVTEALKVTNPDGSVFLAVPVHGEPSGELMERHPEAAPALKELGIRLLELLRR